MKQDTPCTIDTIYFDPKAILLKDPGILLDPHYLGSLHAQLEGEIGPAKAEITLFQMGFLHGLNDAMRAVNDAFGDDYSEPSPLVGPTLAFRVQAEATSETSAAINLQGVWPERTEAAARLASMGRPSQSSCFLTAGYTSGWLSGTLDADIIAMETECSACDSDNCSFVARETSTWREQQDPNSQRFIDALPFSSFRDFVDTSHSSPTPLEGDSDYCDPAPSVVHIWGPVMVIPFSNANEALRAVELIGHDPAARDVSVVVVDFTGVIVDDAFGAAALEQIVETIDNWGAESIFASVSPLSEIVVAELERQPLYIHKDLAQAIAAGFQIANSQRSRA